jgi:ABC-type multidrug transport system fused ATPase/permease subunit
MKIARSWYDEVAQVGQLLRSVSDRRTLRLGAGIVVVVVASGTLAALTPLALKVLIDALAALHTSKAIVHASSALPAGLAYLLILLAGRVLADIRPQLNGLINQRLHSRLSQRFFDHVLRLPMGYLLRRKSGELLHSLDLASGGAQLVISHLVGSLLPVLVELFAMITVLIHLGQPALVWVFLAASGAYLVIFSFGARQMTGTSRDVARSSLESHGQLNAGLAHVETLRYFAAEDQASRRFRTASALLEQRWRHLHRLVALIALAATATFSISTAICLCIGVGAVADGTMTVGGFVLASVYMLQMVRPLESLGNAARDLSRAVGYLHPFLDLLQQPLAADMLRDAAITTGTVTGPKRAPSVRLENVHFGYDADRPVIRGVDLDVPAGRTTAIVGRSGSGKSSLARLLMGLYMPQQGRILLDGRAIDSIAAAELRGTLIGLVPQETALLHETIAGNIALGMPDATPEAIRLAAHGAQLQDLIDALPSGLDTPVGERGLQLSGGERQRVGIARALLRRPGLYILDESTSMLDSKTELDILETLRTISADATKIIIAHRLSTIVDADEIVVLDDGRIRERGRHQALLEENGLYALMWRQQTTAAV